MAGAGIGCRRPGLRVQVFRVVRPADHRRRGGLASDRERSARRASGRPARADRRLRDRAACRQRVPEHGVDGVASDGRRPHRRQGVAAPAHPAVESGPRRRPRARRSPPRRRGSGPRCAGGCRWLTVLWSWLVASGVFAASFVAVSPYSLRRAAFVKGLFVEASDAAAATPLSAAWLSTWLRGMGAAVEWPVLVAALATIAGVAWMAGRHRTHVNPADPILIAWIVLYGLVLAAPVHEFYVQYALPLAPPAAMLAGRGAVAAAEWLARVSRAGPAALAATAGDGRPLCGRPRDRRSAWRESSGRARAVAEPRAHERRGGGGQVARMPGPELGANCLRLLFVRAAGISGRLADMGRYARLVVAAQSRHRDRQRA